MADFPGLKTGAGAQYPARKRVEFATRVLRFVNGAEQRFRQAAARRQWRIRLDLLDEAELRGYESFFSGRQGAFGTFGFADPWDGLAYADCSFAADRLETERSGEGRGGTEMEIRENQA